MPRPRGPRGPSPRLRPDQSTSLPCDRTRGPLYLGGAALRLRSFILQVPSPVMVLLAAAWRASSLALARAPTAHGVAAHW